MEMPEFTFVNSLIISFIGSMIWLIAIYKLSVVWWVISCFIMFGGTGGTAVVMYYHFDQVRHMYIYCTIVWACMMVAIAYGLYMAFKRNGKQ